MARVLIVESYQSLAALYREILSEEGHEVLEASNSKEVNDLTMREEIDLVVIDENLRDRDEEELISKLRTDQPNIKAILCSVTESSPKTYRDLCDEVFPKTYDYTILLEKVAALSQNTSGSRRRRHLLDMIH